MQINSIPAYINKIPSHQDSCARTGNQRPLQPLYQAYRDLFQLSSSQTVMLQNKYGNRMIIDLSEPDERKQLVKLNGWEIITW